MTNCSYGFQLKPQRTKHKAIVKKNHVDLLSKKIIKSKAAPAQDEVLRASCSRFGRVERLSEASGVIWASLFCRICQPFLSVHTWEITVDSPSFTICVRNVLRTHKFLQTKNLFSSLTLQRKLLLVQIFPGKECWNDVLVCLVRWNGIEEYSSIILQIFQRCFQSVTE